MYRSSLSSSPSLIKFLIAHILEPLLLPGAILVRSSLSAATITLAATFLLMERMFFKLGYTRPSLRSFSVSKSVTASAAAISIQSETIFVSTSFAPSASPGNTYMLLDWQDATTLPSSIMTSFCGLPLAKIALPPHAFWPSSAVHSSLCVGFDIGKRMGLSWCFPNSVRISLVKILPAPERPIRTCGLTIETTERQSIPSSTPSVLANFCTFGSKPVLLSVISPSASRM
mmetsp:Transcript_31134/g.54722  ORF Transcript_31134/g.54722 Transcript_31134/m.54722 type:complete len:229 (+) Transcript_31134:301-987(+)